MQKKMINYFIFIKGCNFIGDYIYLTSEKRKIIDKITSEKREHLYLVRHHKYQ
jgi:hypothetical protein